MTRSRSSILAMAEDLPGLNKEKSARAVGNNFEILRKSLPKLVERSADSLAKLRECVEKLASSRSVGWVGGGNNQ